MACNSLLRGLCVHRAGSRLSGYRRLVMAPTPVDVNTTFNNSAPITIDVIRDTDVTTSNLRIDVSVLSGRS